MRIDSHLVERADARIFASVKRDGRTNTLRKSYSPTGYFCNQIHLPARFVSPVGQYSAQARDHTLFLKAVGPSIRMRKSFSPAGHCCNHI